MKERAELVETIVGGLSVRQQCELMGISRGAYYYEPRPESAENLAIMRRLDELHLDRPVYGSLRLTARLRREGARVFTAYAADMRIQPRVSANLL